MTITTTKKQIIYINKIRLKKTVISLLKILSIASGFCGAFWIMGTAGTSDNEVMTIYQILTQVIKGGIFCGISYILNFVKNALQYGGFENVY